MRSEKAIVIAHYNRLGKLRPDTQELLTKLQPEYNHIYLISTDLNEDELKKIPKGIHVEIRENIGYDFYSYRAGILDLASKVDIWEGIQELTIMNTSFVIFDVKKFIENYFQQLDKKNDFDVFGLSKSFEKREHLQSFLVTFSSSVIHRLSFIDWWESMTPINDREEVITKYEFGLSNLLIQEKFILDAWMIGSDHPKILNPSHARFLEIFQNFGIMKIEVFKHNPFKLKLSPWLKQIKSNAKLKRVLTAGLNN